MNNTIIVGVGGVLVGFVIAMMVTPFSGPRDRDSVLVQKYQTPENNQMMKGIDGHFIEQMIPHHDGAIAMATMALEKSERTEIQTLARAIIDAQTIEIKDMRGWYTAWYDTDVLDGDTTMMNGGMMSGGGMHMGGQDDVRTLSNASDFDKAFIEQMIPHHQMAIVMAQMLEAGTNRPEMKTLAQNIIVSQSAEIEQMRDWYATWYQ